MKKRLCISCRTISICTFGFINKSRFQKSLLNFKFPSSRFIVGGCKTDLNKWLFQTQLNMCSKNNLCCFWIYPKYVCQKVNAFTGVIFLMWHYWICKITAKGRKLCINSFFQLLHHSCFYQLQKFRITLTKTSINNTQYGYFKILPLVASCFCYKILSNVAFIETIDKQVNHRLLGYTWTTRKGTKSREDILRQNCSVCCHLRTEQNRWK